LKALPKLRRIRLDGNATMTDKVADALVTFPSLAEISVVGTKLTAKGLTVLRKKDGLTVSSE
jgi:primosomal protein N'